MDRGGDLSDVSDHAHHDRVAANNQGFGVLGQVNDDVCSWLGPIGNVDLQIKPSPLEWLGHKLLEELLLTRFALARISGELVERD